MLAVLSSGRRDDVIRVALGFPSEDMGSRVTAMEGSMSRTWASWLLPICGLQLWWLVEMKAFFKGKCFMVVC